MNKTTPGYTLIELLVGLTIIGLLFGFGYITYRDFARRQSVASASKKIVGDLRLTQALASSGKKPDENVCNSPNILEGYRIDFDASGYSVSAVCSAGEIEVNSYQISPDLSLAPPSPNPIIFNVLENGTNIEDGTEAEIVITQAGTENTKSITVATTGDIK